MSSNLHDDDPSWEGSSRAKPTPGMPPPHTQATSFSQGQSQQLPHETNFRMVPDQGFGQHIARPYANPPMTETSPQPYPTPSFHHQHSSARVQEHRPIVLEDQLRHMILSNNAGSTRQEAVPGPSAGGPSQQASSTTHHRNFRRPNQMQRKQQAQEVQIPVQYASLQTNLAGVRGPGQSQHQGPRAPPGFYPNRQQPVSAPLQYDINQRRPHGAGPQSRALFDPNTVSGRGRGVGNNNAVRFANNQAQLNYIDRLANAKIEEVQITPEELREKQLLKQHLNDICREVIIQHEVSTNPAFPTDGVELKSFGSLSIGFATKESDMDLVLISPESTPELSSPNSPLPRMVEKALMDRGYGVRLLTQTRVPIIKFCEKPGNELAAHLRLTRLYWQKENAARDGQPSFEDVEEALGTSAVKLEDLQSLEEPDLSSSVVESHTSEEKSLSGPASTKEDDKKTPRGKSKVDPAWIPTLSDLELIGFFRAVIKQDWCESQPRAIITANLDRLEDRSLPEDSETLQGSRKALWNMSDIIEKCRMPSREDLEFPKSGVGTQCDFNFSNQLALHNSLLLKCYSVCDTRVRQMVLFVKAWTKRRKINSPYHGTLNSYGYVLMVLHFLMNVVQPPLIPNLQLAVDMIRNDPLSSREVLSDVHNVQFFRNEAALQEMAQNGVFGQNKESLGSLLRGFFRFYADPPFGKFSWKDDVLSLRTKGGILTKIGKGWVGARTETVDLAGPDPGQKKVNHRYVVAIEDPFETGHNVARTVFFNGVVAIRDEFRRAIDLISHAGMDPRTGPQDFFAEGKKNENLQQRHGPPRKHMAPKKQSETTKSDVGKPKPDLMGNGGNQDGKPKEPGASPEARHSSTAKDLP